MFFMNRDTRKKAVLKAVSISIFAVLFYTVCDDNGVKVVTPEVTTFKDIRDDKIYRKVQIGEQIWMAENLNYAADGSVCYDDGYTGSWHRDPAGFCGDYGRLYDWYTAMDDEGGSNANPSGVEGVCPVGWHIPSDAEWTELIEYVGINAGTKLKSRAFKGTDGTQDGTDKYRFAALPSGIGSLLSVTFFPIIGSSPPYFFHGGKVGYWWSATEVESDGNKAWFRAVGPQSGVGKSGFDKHYLLSVRCVHD
jgi:uncharacterized protein (TIGR02145 family)